MTKDELKKLTYEDQYELAMDCEDPKILKLLYQIGNYDIKEAIALNPNTSYELIEKHYEKYNKD